MTQRITDSMLEQRIAYLNKITGSPMAPYIDGQAQIGNYHLSHAYGGVCVHRMSNKSGGVSAPILRYHAPKRECFDTLNAYIAGIEAFKSFDA